MKKNYTISIPKKFFWTIYLPLALIVIGFGSASGIMIIDRIIMPNFSDVKNKDMVSVPELVGIKSDIARQKLYDIGLRLQIHDKEYSDSYELDMIMNQQPEAGKMVKKGRHIIAITSKGSEIDTIPDVRKMAEGVGKKILREAGFGEINVNRAYSDRYPKDCIIATSPEQGTIVSREYPVEIVLSKGPRPTHAVVPNVVGDLLSSAKEKIEENGLHVGEINYKTQSVSKPGTVISQSISPGTHAPLESYIDLVIAAKK